jgi:ADP-heptose:LPS heptosyltransferase
MTPVPHTLARYALFGFVAMYMVADLLPGRRKAPPAAPRRILIAHHLLLGDTIMLTPLIAKCRLRWPDAEILMTCPTDYTELFARRPFGVRILPYDRSDARSIMTLLAQPNVDLAFIPGDNRMSWLARAKNARWIVAFAGDSPAYKDWPVDELRAYPDAPMAWGDLVAGLVDGPAPRPFRTSDWPAPDAAPFARPDAPYCVLHIGASTPLKRWPTERWRVLVDRLRAKGYVVALTAGPEEAQLLDSVDPEHRCARFGGTLSLAQLWHLLAGAALLVCPDTGIAHLARLIGVPTVALFGPGSALLSGAGDFWRDAPFTALTIPDFPCRDQRVTMKREVAWLRRCERLPGDPPDRCPQARCMDALTPELVWQAVAARLGDAPSM